MPKILYVEDNDDNIYMLTGRLRRHGFEFMLANPLFSISRWAATQPYREEAMRAHFIEDYRKARLPDYCPRGAR